MRRKTLLIALAVVVAAIVLAAGPGVAFYTDLLWFDDIGFGNFYRHRLVMEIVLFFVGALVFGGIAGLNIYLARRLSPLRPLAITNDVLFNLRRTLDPAIRWILLGIVAVGAIAFGLAAFPEWQSFTLFFNSQPFGITDPVFGNDVGFYVFSLPVLRFVFGWLFGAFIVSTLAVAAVYAYAGAIGPQPEGGYLAPQPRTHISVLLGFLLLLKAGAYQINQWELLYSPRGVVAGASYTDVNAQLPAFRVLFWIAIGAAILLFATFWIKRLVLPVVAIALMAISALVVGGIYPRIVQQFQVEPNEVEKEAEFIGRNIQFTRQGLGLDDVQAEGFPAEGTITDQQLAENVTVLKNIRLWDDDPLLTTYRQIQELRPYYNFQSVGVDRYVVGGEKTQTLMSAREVDPTQLEARARTWQNLHLVYTHGFGAVTSPSNAVTESGGPQLLTSDLPPRNVTDNAALNLDQPRIYFGQRTEDFIVVNTTLDELDRPSTQGTTEKEELEEINEPDTTAATSGTEEGSDQAQQGADKSGENADEEVERYRYTADSGIRLDSIIKKMAFAIKFGQMQFLLSDAIQSDSRLLLNRVVEERVATVAPFLRIDRSPYLVALEDRIVWIVDAYTESSLYPYSEPITEGIFAGDTNYVRNSVKAVVDAFTGDVTLYRVDESDPVAAAWAKAIPGIMKDSDDVSDELRAHFRYPQDLFEAQLSTYSAYHMDSPVDFYNREDLWAVAQRPGAAPDTQQTQGTTFNAQSQYLELRLPGETNEEFVLFNSYTPARKDNLVAILVARSDPKHYGKLVNLVLPRQRLVNGPRQVEALIQQEPSISEQVTLLSQSGSRLEFGQIRIVPVADSLLYVQPLYLRSTDAARPELKLVVLGFGNQVVMRTTFSEALSALFGATPLQQAPQPVPTEPTPGPTPGPAPAPTPDLATAEQVQALVSEIDNINTQQEEALRSGDLEAFGRLQKELGDKIADLKRLSQQLATTSTE